MKALVCIKPRELEYREVNTPVAGPGQAIIKIRRIGICGTDLHAFDGTQPFFEYPRICGHELSGDLVEIGKGPGFIVGEAVTVIPYFNCGVCIACRSSKPNCCVTLRVCGVHVDGAMVDYLCVDVAALVRGPAGGGAAGRVCVGDRGGTDRFGNYGGGQDCGRKGHRIGYQCGSAAFLPGQTAGVTYGHSRARSVGGYTTNYKGEHAEGGDGCDEGRIYQSDDVHNAPGCFRPGEGGISRMAGCKEWVD
jgi:hypothetical protein